MRARIRQDFATMILTSDINQDIMSHWELLNITMDNDEPSLNGNARILGGWYYEINNMILITSILYHPENYTY